MAIKIRTDIFAMDAIRGLSKSSQGLSEVRMRLASGSRINKASDDAAGLSIALSLNKDSRVFNQAIKNINDGISVMQIASNAISSLKDINIIRQELAEQSANGVYTDKQRESLNKEFFELSCEYSRIINSTEFNGVNLFNGGLDGLSLQLGYSELELNFGAALEDMKTLGVFPVGYTNERASTQVVASLSGGFSSDVALGDLNGDGFLDMVVSDYGTAGQCTTGGYSNTISVSMSKGDGTFEDAVFYELGVGSRPHNVSLADINGDGNLDIVTDTAQNDVVYLMTNNGDGTFNTDTTFDPNWWVLNSVGTGDINGDGNVDLVSLGRDGSGYGAFVNIGNGSGGFNVSATSASTVGAVFNMAIKDIDDDGKDDVVTANRANGSFSVFKSNGSNLNAGQTYSVGSTVYDVAIGDLDGDGKGDVAVASAGGVAIYTQNPDGTFSHAKSFNVGATTAIEIADIDNDGTLDIVSAQGPANTVNTFINKGGLSFTKQTAYAGSGAMALAVGDINNDGMLDAAITNPNDSTTTTLTAGEVYLDISRQASALGAIDELKRYMSVLSNCQGQIGAFEARLETASQVMQISKENYKAAEAVISDIDVAEASSQAVRLDILQQASSSIIAQANLQADIALKLLNFSNTKK